MTDDFFDKENMVAFCRPSWIPHPDELTYLQNVNERHNEMRYELSQIGPFVNPDGSLSHRKACVDDEGVVTCICGLED